MTTTTLITLRIPPERLEQIDEDAKALNMSRTQYMISAALGRLPDQQTSLEGRVDQLERCTQRLERALLYSD